MRRIRSNDTSPEMLVRRLVHAMGFRYRLHDAKLPGKPDMVFARLQRIIEVRGCFWHQHGKCIDSHIPQSRQEYWIPKLQRNLRRDADNQRSLRRLGWKVLVVWECEVANPKLPMRLKRFLTNNRAS
jgi:DNA mismatch endonuclease, patch repair protein